jgi:hypothetical protein
MNSIVTTSVLLIIDIYLIEISSVVLVIFAIEGHSFNFYIFARPKFLKESIFRYFLASEIVSLTTIIMLGIYKNIETKNCINKNDERELKNQNTKIVNSTEIKILTLNCKNLKSNVEYINEEIENHDIIFIQEHWLNEIEINNINDYINCENVKAELISSIDIVQQKQGRPHGGIGWLIKNSIKVSEIKHISKRISMLILNDRTCIIGVYMQCNNNNITSYNEHLHDINQISGIIQNKENISNCLLIIGDFNADINRNNKFDYY